MINRLHIFCLLIIGIFFIPGIVSAGEDGWTHGSLFSAPDWLLEMYDDDTKSMSGLDYYGYKVQEPTVAPPTYTDYIKQGWGYLEGANYKDAQTAFENALKINSTSSDAWYGKGLSLENQKRYLSATDSFAKAISNSKGTGNSYGPYAGEGRCYLMVQQYQNAKDAFNSAISLYEKSGANKPDELAEMYRGLAQALEAIGDVQGAKDALQKAG